jgi:hypothetical protein
MSTAVSTPAIQHDDAKNLWFVEYQPLDREGNPVGRLQRFEGATESELAGKLLAAHSNATVAYHEERKARKLENFVQPKKSRPIYSFESRPLTADERVQIAADARKPESVVEAIRTVIEAEFGAPLDVVRENLRDVEEKKQREFLLAEATAFQESHPDYYPCPANERDMYAYMQRKDYAFDRDGLALAFDALRNDLVQRPAPPAAPVVSNSPAAPVAAATTEPPSSGGNSAPATTALPSNSGDAAAVRVTSTSSSGLSSRASSTPLPANAAATAPETVEYTPEFIANLDAKTYGELMRTKPGFEAAVNKLYAKK